MICKDCIHYDLCGTITRPCMPDEANASERLCSDFKNKADFAEVKHGEWILHPDGSGTCKICNTRQKAIWDMDNWQNFCGRCGAKMSEMPTGSERSD